MNKCSVFPLEVPVLFYSWIQGALSKQEVASIKLNNKTVGFHYW